MKEKLIILDFKVQDVTIHIYPIDSNIEVDEEYIQNLGFNPDYCSWHFGTEVKIIEHQDEAI